MTFQQVLFLLMFSYVFGNNCLVETEDESEKVFESRDFNPNQEKCLELATDSTYLPNVTLQITVAQLSLNDEHGDLLLVGPGRRKKMFLGSPSWMIVESLENQRFLVMGKDATVVLVARNEYPKRYLKVEWKRLGKRGDIPTIAPPTTPVSEADRKALVLCFKKRPITCEEFEQNSKGFKNSLADRANQYAERMKLDLQRRVTPGDIKANCFVVTPNNEQSQNATRQQNFLIVTITDKRNPEIPVFTTDQLREIISDFDTQQSFGIAECRSYPNYWWWFWGSAIMLIIIMIMLIICWKLSSDFSLNITFGNVGTNEGSSKKEIVENGQVNHGFQNDFFYDIPEPSDELDAPKSSKLGRKLPKPPAVIEGISEDSAATSLHSSSTHFDKSHISPSREVSDPDAVSMKSQHLYEDPEKLKHILNSPAVSFRKGNNIDDDHDEESNL